MKKYKFKNWIPISEKVKVVEDSVHFTIFVKILKYEKSISLKDTQLCVKVIVCGGNPRALVSIRVV